MRTGFPGSRSEEHTSELQPQSNLVCRLLLEKNKAIEFIRTRALRLITNLPVLTEATSLLRFSVAPQRDLLCWAHKCIEIDQDTSTDMPIIITILEKYHDLPADFADASLVALAERLNVSRVASVD